MPRKICLICSRPLVMFQLLGAEIWIHAPGQVEDRDHMPLPVDDIDWSVRQRCDFCNADPAVGLLPVAGEIRMPLSVICVNEPWAVCATCRDLISANQWDDLIRHIADTVIATRIVSETTKHSLLDELSQLIREVRTHATGPVQPLNECTPESPIGGKDEEVS
ncbi:hypothetical protein Ga0074812_14743 [Parafrankia irregularis]|uniref:Uncharacterized protein n=1 Tax=Parafrankia irregularis TaxID=795642 RepID=A0A0S4QZ22_9ACTN|nr:MULTISPECIES: hypothetical protein [Parafrankia]MBE3206644.1 hypothetical protein [Parafrankia sp. CH37]CUU60797.1 hypothetical protein Ga0074812_14743 [Parafrankia irregularis]